MTTTLILVRMSLRLSRRFADTIVKRKLIMDLYFVIFEPPRLRSVRTKRQQKRPGKQLRNNKTTNNKSRTYWTKLMAPLKTRAVHHNKRKRKKNSTVAIKVQTIMMKNQAPPTTHNKKNPKIKRKTLLKNRVRRNENEV